MKRQIVLKNGMFILKITKNLTNKSLMNNLVKFFMIAIVLLQFGCNKHMNNKIQYYENTTSNIHEFYTYEDSAIYREQEIIYKKIIAYSQVEKIKNQLIDSTYEVYYYAFNGGTGYHEICYGIINQASGFFVKIDKYNQNKQRIEELNSYSIKVINSGFKSSFYKNKFLLQNCGTYGRRNCIIVKHDGEIMFCYLFFTQSNLPKEFESINQILKIFGVH